MDSFSRGITRVIYGKDDCDGKRKKRRGRRRSSIKTRKTLKGGSAAAIGAALLPFGLLGLQKYMQSIKYPRGGISTKRKTTRNIRQKKTIKLSEEPL